MLPNLQIYVNTLWGVFLLVWLMASFNVKRTVAAQPIASRALQVIVVTVGFVLIFSRIFDYSLFARPLLPPVSVVPYLGLILAVSGVGLAIWARFFIGRNWSADVTLKQDHQLIRSGPYRLVRHPIYSGLLLALLGTVLITNEFKGYLGILFCAFGFHLKAAVEEKFMTQRFGGEYQQYQQQTKALIPFLL